MHPEDFTTDNTNDDLRHCNTSPVLTHYTDPNYGPYTTTPTASGQHLIITYNNGCTFYQPVLYPPAMTTTQQRPMTPLPPSANISIRDYIYYLPHPLPPDTPIPYSTGLPHNNPLNLDPHATEPTSTLVLTSPRGTFVDIRILLPLNTTTNTDTDTNTDTNIPEPLLPNTGGPLTRLEWAFGGKSTSYKYDEVQEGEGPSHSVWRHWVDSKVGVGEEMEVDEGDMYALDDGRTLEHGSSFNAAIGKMHSYEEMWSDLSIDACFPSDKKVVVVLRVEIGSAGIRGLVVRLGQFCQGILMKGKEVSVERWEYVEHVDGDESVVGGEWTRMMKLGDLFLPCASTFKHDELRVDAVVKYTDYEWVVEELSEW